MVCDVFFQNKHLPTADTRTDITQTVIVADMLMLIVWEGLTCLRSKELHPVGLCLGMTNQGSSPTGGNHFVAIEGKDAVFAKGSAILPVVHGPHRLSGIFDHGDVVGSSDLHNLIDTCRIAIKIDGNNSLWLSSRLLYSIFYGCLQQGRIHVPGTFFTIDKNRGCAKVANRIGRSRECKALTNHLITGTNAQHDQRQMNGSCACAECYYMNITLRSMRGKPVF